MTPQQLEERLLKLPHEIYVANEEAIKAGEEFQKAKAEYEDALDSEYLKLKAKSDKATVKELEAMARQVTQEKRLAVIIQEAKLHSLKNKAEKLKTAFAACQSAIKLRAVEMQSLGG